MACEVSIRSISYGIYIGPNKGPQATIHVLRFDLSYLNYSEQNLTFFMQLYA